MKKIVFLCNWGDTSKHLLNQYKNTTPNSSGIWETLKGVENIKEADYYIILEDPPNRLDLKSIDTDKIICFPREPPCIRSQKYYTSLKIKHNYTYKNIYHVVPQFNFLGKTFDELANLEYTEKTQKLSCVVSGKRHTSGARLRLEVVDQVLKKYSEICLYGKGLPYEKSSVYKGQVKYKYEALAPYRYSLCFENSSVKNYFSEKFTDTILSWTVPIYWGCSNIAQYFPVDSYYYVDITKPNAVDEIIKIANRPITKKNINALRAARKLILYNYNIWPTILRIIT